MILIARLIDDIVHAALLTDHGSHLTVSSEVSGRAVGVRAVLDGRPAALVLQTLDGPVPEGVHPLDAALARSTRRAGHGPR